MSQIMVFESQIVKKIAIFGFEFANKFKGLETPTSSPNWSPNLRMDYSEIFDSRFNMEQRFILQPFMGIQWIQSTSQREGTM